MIGEVGGNMANDGRKIDKNSSIASDGGVDLKIGENEIQQKYSSHAPKQV